MYVHTYICTYIHTYVFSIGSNGHQYQRHFSYSFGINNHRETKHSRKAIFKPDDANKVVGQFPNLLFLIHLEIEQMGHY